MNEKPTIFAFRIGAWTPATLPLSRLNAYLDELIVLFGHADHVHLTCIAPGSAVPKFAVDYAWAPKVRDRLQCANRLDAPSDVRRARDRINRLLRDDNATGSLREIGGAKILVFKGRDTPINQEALVTEAGVVDGVVVRVGGKDETVPVLVETDGRDYVHCTTSRERARALGHHLFGAELRLTGRGQWRRDADGVWTLEKFLIEAFTELRGTALVETADALRAVEGSGWAELDDPLEYFRRIRGE